MQMLKSNRLKNEERDQVINAEHEKEKYQKEFILSPIKNCKLISRNEFKYNLKNILLLTTSLYCIFIIVCNYHLVPKKWAYRYDLTSLNIAMCYHRSSSSLLFLFSIPLLRGCRHEYNRLCSHQNLAPQQAVSSTVPLENNDGSREIIFSVNFFSWFQDRTGTINISPDTSQ